jgi:quinol monooxygenase YgiN
MSTIQQGSGVVTFINVFTVQPEKQQELVTLLTNAAHETMRHLPGFVSANIHRSLDGKRVVNYAQWASMAEFEAMRKNPQAMAHIQAVAVLGQFDPMLCEVSAAISIES